MELSLASSGWSLRTLLGVNPHTHIHTHAQEMKTEMSKVCGNKEVRIGTGPRLEVKGRFTRELRGWLAGLGF